MKDSRRRWLERGKTLLIVLLTLSAMLLIYFSPLVQSSGVQALFDGGLNDRTAQSLPPRALPAAAIPVQMAVGTTVGLYGVQYDQETVDALFDQAGPLLGEALANAGQPAALSEEEWQELLSGQCVYFSYLRPLPLSLLCRWLTGKAAPSALTASARRIILAAQGDGTLSLYYQAGDEGSYHRCSTTLDADLHLSPITEGVSPNSAAFAFEDESLSGILTDYTLVTNEETSGQIYHSATPISLTDQGQLSQLLSALSFSDQNQASLSDVSIFVDGDDTLRVYGDGQVRFHSSGEARYPAGEGLSGAAAAVWPLAEASLGALCGEARLYLLSALADEEENRYTITFGYCLNGSPVYLYDQGWAAQFQVQEGSVTDFTLYLRSYSATGRQALLLPAERAAAALTALTDQPRELVIRYRDNGSSDTEPGWVGQ